ncbi:MAG: methyltransferase domain-containing protein [Planctomycetota bacterium]
MLLALAGCRAEADPAPAAPEPHQETRSAVPTDINDKFLDPTSPVEEWSARWEVESREVFACRDQIVAALALQPGQAVADVGTGTGLFLGPFSRAVGDAGRVFAVDIAQKFVDHVQKRAQKEEMHNVVAVLSNERSVALAAGSVDAIFVCDAYHHFEYHEDMLRSIHSALRPGGRLVIVDFERIPGVSREWILGHVRAGKEVVTGEVLGAGFRLEREVKVDGFEENYLLVFTRT